SSLVNLALSTLELFLTIFLSIGSFFFSFFCLFSFLVFGSFFFSLSFLSLLPFFSFFLLVSVFSFFSLDWTSFLESSTVSSSVIFPINANTRRTININHHFL